MPPCLLEMFCSLRFTVAPHFVLNFMLFTVLNQQEYIREMQSCGDFKQWHLESKYTIKLDRVRRR